MIETILLSAARVFTYTGDARLTNASGFFFERDRRLFLVTSRHVFHDESTGHAPDRIEIELHTDPENMARSTWFSIPLYRDGNAAWRQGVDSAGQVDIAAIEIERDKLPATMAFRAFTPQHLDYEPEQVRVGTRLLIVGFPLGFHDTLHHMPVGRDAIVASSFGLRFQGEGYFLTDARTHRGVSGAPVVTAASAAHGVAKEDLPWVLLGVHSAMLDMGTREVGVDEALGLNCAWYADILMTLTEG